MKTAAQLHNTFGTPSKSGIAYRPNVPLEQAIRTHLSKFYLSPALNAADSILKNATGKLTAKYFMDAFNVLLKQNLLGADIDMEFFMLTVRVYGSSVLNLAAKGSAALNFKVLAGSKNNLPMLGRTLSFIN
ncbi:MAG: hypothetical protein JWP44_2297 [Mucilaginibacter sp.]|nr:hypothetical protein [Mucilaginibacter sp.]